MLATEGGNIQVDRAGSTVDAHTGEGVIEISQAGGNGDGRYARRVDPGGLGARREVRIGGGDHPGEDAWSGPLKVQTAMGSILAELLAGARIEDASLMAGSGDITVLIPSNLALSVVARNDTGGNPRIVSDFSEMRAKAFRRFSRGRNWCMRDRSTAVVR